MQKHRSDKAMIMGNVHAGGGRSGRREWWERIVLDHVKQYAHEYRGALTAGQSYGASERIKAAGSVIRALRRHSRQWALKQVMRVSEALGLYEEE